MTKRRWLMLALGAAAVLLIVGRAVAGVYADYLWYESLGAAALWRTRLARDRHPPRRLRARRRPLRVCESVRRAAVGRLARVSAARRQPRDRRRGAGPVPHGDRRRPVAGARHSARAAAAGLDVARARAVGAADSARPIRTSTPIWASSSTGCRSRTRCGRGRSSRASSSSSP